MTNPGRVERLHQRPILHLDGCANVRAFYQALHLRFVEYARQFSFLFREWDPQAQLAQIIGISQNTLSFYEREAGDIPARLVPPLAKALGVSLEEVLGVNQSAAKKRGPKSQLERQLETVADSPRSTQRKIMDVLNALIAQHKAAS